MNGSMTKQALAIEIGGEIDFDARRTDWRSVRAVPDGSPMRPALGGALVGSLVALDGRGRPLVEFPGNHGGDVRAVRSTVEVEGKDAGRQVVLVFEEGDPERPIIVGLLQQSHAGRSAAAQTESPAVRSPIAVKVDDEEIVLSADKQIVLRCGKASLTLTRAGKVLIRGEYVLSRSSGVNRIKGGSVQIN
jgi:hypothetical protein